MKDLTGLGKASEAAAKLADSELINKVYDEGFSGAIKEGGIFLTDLAKATRLLVSRIIKLDPQRYEGYARKVESAVLVQNQIEADPAIAGPVLENLKYLEPTNPLVELYLQLLTRAIDRTRSREAHPAYIKIIEQLSKDEALILWILHAEGHRVVSFPATGDLSAWHFPLHILSSPEQFYICTSHLSSLSLVSVTMDIDYALHRKDAPGKRLPREAIVDSRNVVNNRHILLPTDFGYLFSQACIPGTFDVMAPGDNPVTLPTTGEPRDTTPTYDG